MDAFRQASKEQDDGAVVISTQGARLAAQGGSFAMAKRLAKGWDLPCPDQVRLLALPSSCTCDAQTPTSVAVIGRATVVVWWGSKLGAGAELTVKWKDADNLWRHLLFVRQWEDIDRFTMTQCGLIWVAHVDATWIGIFLVDQTLIAKEKIFHGSGRDGG